MAGVEIEIKCYPWNFSPILNVIVTQLSPGITRRLTGDLGGNKWQGYPVDTRSILVYGWDGLLLGDRIPTPNLLPLNALRERRRALKIIKSQPNLENHIRFQRARSKARLTFENSKRTSWRECPSSLTPQTTISEIWNIIRGSTPQVLQTFTDLLFYSSLNQ